MNKFYILGVVVLGFFIVVGIYYTFFHELPKPKETKLYQGPVRPTDDLEHFRRTGETIPLIKE